MALNSVVAPGITNLFVLTKNPPTAEKGLTTSKSSGLITKSIVRENLGIPLGIFRLASLINYLEWRILLKSVIFTCTFFYH